ncbi:hypothetical protein SDC9_170692 [bioreactor metagenome]|uniref:Uncharacterized protein n=1 Tax=bioreactor metagenome TaxID=1076179 RepID=A0A645GHE1_9ZZZZ
MIAILERSRIGIRRRSVQRTHGLGKARQAQLGERIGRQSLFQRHQVERPLHQLAQSSLPQAGRGRINRGQGIRQGFGLFDRAHSWMHHLKTKESTAYFAKQAHPTPGGHLLLL